MIPTARVALLHGSGENAGGNNLNQRQEALLKTGALQNAILHSANFSIIATDEKGIIQLFNIGAEHLLGYTAAEVVNKLSPADIHDADEVTARAATLSVQFATAIEPGFGALAFKASRGLEDIYELTYRRKDGSRIPSIESITALRGKAGNGGADIIGYLLIATNNSVHKQEEMELATAKAAVEKVSREKSDFLVQLSHELRTPLNVILGFAQLIESGVPPPAPSQKQSLEQILTAGRYLLELANEILDRALIESGQVTFSQEPVSVGEILNECQAMILPQAKRRHIDMTFPVFDRDCYVKADRTRVKQVLMNLLLNAIKYNKLGGAVAVEYKMTRPDTVRICVRDTGKGLTVEQLSQLFQPFNRLGQEAGEEEGAGIGLVVSKQLVEVMGGTIGASSTVGEGSVFWIDLDTTAAPQLTPPDGARAPAVHPPIAEASPSPNSVSLRKVLYVEDNPANLELVRQLIVRHANLRLFTATDGALGVASARANHPDVILMDLNMPGMNGREALKILRNDPSTAHIPVIALSANAMPRDIESGLKAGFFNYLTKPIEVTQFMKALDLALSFAELSSRRSTNRK